jgi:hypothetical protein
MKNEMWVALIILATLPLSAQNVGPNGSPNREEVTALAQDYAARVDGLLREVHACLQGISEGVEAGRLTPEQGRELKLAATRDMISRLDTLSAVYDVRLERKDKVHGESGPVFRDVSAEDKPGAAPSTSRTVSVEELRQERAVAAPTPSVVKVTR